MFAYENHLQFSIMWFLFVDFVWNKIILFVLILLYYGMTTLDF